MVIFSTGVLKVTMLGWFGGFSGLCCFFMKMSGVLKVLVLIILWVGLGFFRACYFILKMPGVLKVYT